MVCRAPDHPGRPSPGPAWIAQPSMHAGMVSSKRKIDTGNKMEELRWTASRCRAG
jgi:hypothetical protein